MPPTIRVLSPPDSISLPQEEAPLPLPVFPSASYPKGWPDITVAFESDALWVLPSEISKLNRFGAALRSSPGLRIHIAGHSALIGSSGGGIVSSWKRAQIVADYLVGNGYVMPDRVDIGGYGAEYPAANNNTWTSRQKNRRVEIFILN
ncbi:hypothetical protein AGMMS49991_02750 [Spirochaetia bacterium]|nr:hypothetical protein AGMMS49991_02750 [Spirochaetia bacterium]